MNIHWPQTRHNNWNPWYLILWLIPFVAVMYTLIAVCWVLTYCMTFGRGRFEFDIR